MRIVFGQLVDELAQFKTANLFLNLFDDALPRQAVNLADCEQVTGSRIRTDRRGNCAPVGYPFKSFSQAELEATGEMDLNSALRQMDPAFR